MDLTYRTELRELNDLNFARFDAKVGERLAELRAELLAEMDSRFAKVDGKISDLRVEMNGRFAQADVTLAQQLEKLKTSLIRWMFVFWVGTGAMVIGWLLASRS